MACASQHCAVVLCLWHCKALGFAFVETYSTRQGAPAEIRLVPPAPRKPLACASVSAKRPHSEHIPMLSSSLSRMSGLLWWLHPDGKTQVAIQYLQQADGSVVPWEIHTVVTSTQHVGLLKATRCKEVVAAPWWCTEQTMTVPEADVGSRMQIAGGGRVPMLEGISIRVMSGPGCRIPRRTCGNARKYLLLKRRVLDADCRWQECANARGHFYPDDVWSRMQNITTDVWHCKRALAVQTSSSGCRLPVAGVCQCRGHLLSR